MLKNNFVKKPQTSSNLTNLLKPKIVFEKQKVVKAKKQAQSKFDKENQSGFGNQQQEKNTDFIDLKKKIKKFCQTATVAKIRYLPAKSFEQDSALLGQMNGIPIFNDQALGFNEELRSKIMPQRIDNDVYTDDQQVQSGINKLLGALQVAITVNQKYEKDQAQKRIKQEQAVSQNKPV